MWVWKEDGYSFAPSPKNTLNICEYFSLFEFLFDNWHIKLMSNRLCWLHLPDRQVPGGENPVDVDLERPRVEALALAALHLDKGG